MAGGVGALKVQSESLGSDATPKGGVTSTLSKVSLCSLAADQCSQRTIDSSGTS